MTLVLEGIPSAGGPRSRRSRGRPWPLPALPSLSPAFSLVTSFRASNSAVVSAPSAGATPSSSFFSSYTFVSHACQSNFTIEATYTATTAAASTSTTATAGAATTTSRLAAAGAFSTALGVSALSLVVRLGLASKLDGDLALKDLLARKLSDSTLRLAGGRQVDKGITNRAVGARVFRDGNRFTAKGT